MAGIRRDSKGRFAGGGPRVAKSRGIRAKSKLNRTPMVARAIKANAVNKKSGLVEARRSVAQSYRSEARNAKMVKAERVPRGTKILGTFGQTQVVRGGNSSSRVTQMLGSKHTGSVSNRDMVQVLKRPSRRIAGSTRAR